MPLAVGPEGHGGRSKCKRWLTYPTLKTVSPFQEKSGPKGAEGTETKSVGSVAIGVYMRYFLAGGGVIVLLLWMLLNVMAQVLFTGSDYWLSFW